MGVVHDVGVTPTDLSAESGLSQSNLLVWIKRVLITIFVLGLLVGGIATCIQFGSVESAVKAHDKWAIVWFPITECMAWISTPFLLGAAARRLGLKKLSFKDIPTKMRELESDRAFRWSMNVNILGAVGTAAGLVVGGASLPGASQFAVYGLAAGSLAISSVPIKVAYLWDRRNRSVGMK